MAHLPNGPYRIKVFPGGPIGGMFATGNGFERPIIVAPSSPPFSDRQAVCTTPLSISHLYSCMLMMAWNHVVEC
jgi:hypothetical protein